MSKNKYILGIDIGGTKIEAALFVPSNMSLVRSLKIETPQTDFIKNLKSLINEIQGSDQITAIGIGIPGELDQNKKTILRAVNTPVIEGLNIVSALYTTFKVPVYMDNDVHALAQGEALFGLGKNYNSIFAITIGTGVGGGFVEKDRLFSGCTNTATEVGHTIIASEGATCVCGNRGCLEEYISARAVRRLSGMSPLELEHKAKEDNPRAKFTWSRIGFYLGLGLANIVNMFNPEIIIIGGGLSKASKYYMENAEKVMRNYTISPLAKKKTKIIIIKTPAAGARGAAALTLKK